MTVTLLYDFYITEHGEDVSSRDFGPLWLPHPPEVGDVLSMRWLDRRLDYDVRVESVDLDRFRLVVRRVQS